jgi:hypothetical protein
MTRPALFLLIPLLALAGCGGDVTPDNESHIRVANPDSERLKALSPVMQRLALMRAIRQTGHRCRRVVAGGYQQFYREMEMWVALCDDGKHWSIFIAGNSDVQVRDCTQHAQLELPQCRLVAPLPPDPLDPGAANAVGNAG